jgi:hypothetical protein
VSTFRRWGVLILAVAVIVATCACGIIKDLDRERWCEDQGLGLGIVWKDGECYCAGGDGTTKAPDYLQPQP